MLIFLPVAQGSVTDTSMWQLSLDCWPASPLPETHHSTPPLSRWLEILNYYMHLFSNHFFWAYRELGIILSAVQIVTHFSPHNDSLGAGTIINSFMGKLKHRERSLVFCPRFHNKQVGQLGFPLDCLVPNHHTEREKS